MLIENPREFSGDRFVAEFDAGRSIFSEPSEAPIFADGLLSRALHEHSCACLACHGLDLSEKADGYDAVFPGTAGSAEDTGSSTTTAGTLNPGSFVIDDIETAGDTDWFAIQLVAGETYTFSTYLIGGGLPDSILTLRNANGSVIVDNDDANFNAQLLYSEIIFTATTSGTYFLDVSGFGTATGQYVLSSSRPVDDNFVDNSSTTGNLVLGDPATVSSLDQTGDHDWFAVTLVAGQTYEFVTSETGGINDVDTTLTLRTASGEVLAYNDDSTGTYSRIRFTAQTSGTFYLDVGGWADGEQGAYQVTADVAAPLEELDNDGIAAQLLYGTNGSPSDLRRFDASEGDTLTVNITSLNSAGQFLARSALELWTDATGINFQEVSNGAQITFQDTEDGAFASSTRSNSFIINATVNVSTAWLDNNGTTLDSYSFQTYLHEIGHALGLRHPGPYNGNGSFDQDAVFLNDSWATTVMSYFSQTQNSFFADQNFSRVFTLTPMIGDMTAIQLAYGEVTGTRTGDNTYGVGNDTGRAVYGVGADVNISGRLQGFTIIDNGGTDTLNYSSFSAAQLINLNPETFSNIGGSIGNMNIARGTVIENAIGGSGNDQLIGNLVGNVLTGGRGNDSIDGGSNVDFAVVSGNRSAYTVTQTSTGVFRVVGTDGTDTLTNIEFLQFDDQTLRLLPGTGVSVNFETSNPTVYQSALNALRDFDGNALGGNGSWLRIGSADVNGDGDIDQILVNDAIGRFATVGTAPDGLVYFEDYSWAGETRVAGIYIDPLVQSGDVVAGSDNDSQRRFQNDLQIENINRVLGGDDYDGDGIWEVYFALTDGTAYLRALMHEDGNIRYANYQSQQEVIDYLTANGYDDDTFGDWFPDVVGQADPAKSENVGLLPEPTAMDRFAAMAEDGAGAPDMFTRGPVDFDPIMAEFYG